MSIEDDDLDIYASEEEFEYPEAPKLGTVDLPESRASPNLLHPPNPMTAVVCNKTFPTSNIRDTRSPSPPYETPTLDVPIVIEPLARPIPGVEHPMDLENRTTIVPLTQPFPHPLDSSQIISDIARRDTNLYWNVSGLRVINEEITQAYTGPLGTEPGIFAYGPISDTEVTPFCDYRIYIHACHHDVLDYFAYGGPKYLDGERVQLHRLPISPTLLSYSLEGLSEHSHVIQQIDAYLRGDPQFREGVLIPPELMSNPIPISAPDEVFFRFPLVEDLLGILAARSSYPRLSHPLGQLTLSQLRTFVSPKFPVLQNPDLLVRDLCTPDLPYIPASFLPFERCHPDDTSSDPPFSYFGCLPRYEAFLFQKYFPIHAPLLFHEVTATLQLVTLHADPKTRPPPSQGGRIDWDSLLEPYGFSDYFPTDTPMRLLFRACPTPTRNNVWFPRTHFVLQCARHVNQLIRAFETFFTTLEYEGLRDIFQDVALNKELDFLYSPILSYGQATYLTALYDFFLREHALFLARPILQLLHISFPEPHQLGMVFDHIIDTVERPLYSYLLYDEDDEDLVSSV
jgi:hypothetical protein